MRHTLVIGIGNVLLRDEGIGVHAARALRERGLPPGVEVIDGGTQTMHLMPDIQDAERIIVIDALQAGGEPGTIYRLTPKDLELRGARSLSLHQVGLLEVLDLVERLGRSPEVLIFGVEPKEIDWGMELSPGIRGKLPRVIELVLGELEAG